MWVKSVQKRDPTLYKQTVMAAILAPNSKAELVVAAKPKRTKNT